MTPSTAEAREFAADAVRQAEHEASRLKAVAVEAVQDGVRATKRAITHGLRDLGDLRDSAAYRVKRAPLLTVGLAFAAGILLGAVIGQVTRKAAAER